MIAAGRERAMRVLTITGLLCLPAPLVLHVGIHADPPGVQGSGEYTGSTTLPSTFADQFSGRSSTLEAIGQRSGALRHRPASRFGPEPPAGPPASHRAGKTAGPPLWAGGSAR